MRKPSDYDNTTAYGEFKPLPAGGYVCKIMEVKETSSSSGKPMVVISLDIAEGEYKDYYKEQYKTDTREDKKWGCRVFQLVYDNENKTNKGFKTFGTAFEESNNMKIAWGDTAQFEACFKSKLIGGVFRREEYEKTDRTGTAWVTRCFTFRSVETIRKGVEVPKDKPLLNKPSGGSDAFSAQGFADVNVSEDDLPF